MNVVYRRTTTEEIIQRSQSVCTQFNIFITYDVQHNRQKFV